MKTPKCYTWLESCGSPLSDGIKKKILVFILQSVWFTMTLRTDIFLYTEKLSYEGLNVPSEVYLSKQYFCEMYPTCVSSKLCEFISNAMSIRNVFSFTPEVFSCTCRSTFHVSTHVQSFKGEAATKNVPNDFKSIRNVSSFTPEIFSCNFQPSDSLGGQSILACQLVIFNMSDNIYLITYVW